MTLRTLGVIARSSAQYSSPTPSTSFSEAKAIAQVNDIFGAPLDPQKFNQATRWVNTKEEHCGKIISLISEYCLCQRVKVIGDPKCPFASEQDYIDALKAHHVAMAAAVKCKQSTDPAAADALA